MTKKKSALATRKRYTTGAQQKKAGTDLAGRNVTKSAKSKARKSASRPASEPFAVATEVGKQSNSGAFPVVGIGASAGGLEAFTQLLGELPPDTGMAFVLVQHLDPRHASMLSGLLAKKTEMPVAEVTDGMPVEPNRIYVIPPNTNMAILNGTLQLMPRTETRGRHMSVDYFFRSLAEDQGSRAVGVVLSGADSDGALGLQAIKAEGGITFAQEERTAKYDGMPRSAIATGAVDFILPPEEIAKELLKFSSHPYMRPRKRPKGAELLLKAEDGLKKIFVLLRAAHQIDFTGYKQTTIKRRIVRRMALHKIERLDDYVRYLQGSPTEVTALYDDLLINVTSFFRDPETFEALKARVFPQILKNRQPESPVRIWVTGCSTGEEAYSMAVCWLEFIGGRAKNVPIQIFATDLNDKGIDKARAGIYPENISLDVSPERLRRYFVKVDGGYQVNKPVRDICVFARQNLIHDPPFSKLDLVCCRNVMIYMESVIQRKLIPIFHYALNPTGYLMLGNSETVGAFSDLFAQVDKKFKLYAKKSALAHPSLKFGPSDPELNNVSKPRKDEGGKKSQIEKEADRIILDQYGPAGVLVKANLEILQFRGHTGFYLEPAPGAVSFDLLKMARPALLPDLRAAIHEAQRRKLPVRREGLRVKYNGQFRKVNLQVVPIPAPASEEGYLLIMFEEAISNRTQPEPEPSRGKRLTKKRAGDSHVTKVEEELVAAREYLRSEITRHQATIDELNSANEEIQSSNEELQSINEEMETAKEELQATNEELGTVNDELQHRNNELSVINDDLLNLLNSINIPILMLDRDLRIRRFTSGARKTLNLIPSDVGRPIDDLKPRINVLSLVPLIMEVLDTLSVKEMEVQDLDGRWYVMRIYPYRTADDKIDGAVLTLIDIDEIKTSRDYAEAIVETVREPLIVLDMNLRVRTANRAFYQIFQVAQEDTEGRLLYELGNNQWDIPQLRTLLEEILPKNNSFQGFKVEHDFPSIGKKVMLLNARRIVGTGDKPRMILLAIEETS
jgi:two-component system, chemotaxis family, CheB/CheR fusion protein